MTISSSPGLPDGKSLSSRMTWPGLLSARRRKLLRPKRLFPGLEYLSGVVKLKDGLIFIHDLERFLSLDEETVPGRGHAGVVARTMTDTIPDELLVRFSDFLAAKIGLVLSSQELARTWPGELRPRPGTWAATAPNSVCGNSCWPPFQRTDRNPGQPPHRRGNLFFSGEEEPGGPGKPPAAGIDPRPPATGTTASPDLGAGCASGEEAYTLAILLSRVITDLEKWQIHILATDISPLALQKASPGPLRQMVVSGHPARDHRAVFRQAGRRNGKFCRTSSGW